MGNRYLLTTTEKVQSGQRLASSIRELNLLNTINDFILRNGDEQLLYEAVCDCIITVGGYKLAWICHKPETIDNRILKPLAAAGMTGYLSKIQIDLNDPQQASGPAGTMFQTGKTFINNNTNNVDFFAPWLKWAKEYDIGSSLSLILDLGGGKAGGLMIYSGQTDAFDDHEVAILERLAANLSLAVQTIRTHGILIESENRFRGAFEDSAIGMGLTSIEKNSMGRWLKVNASLCEMLGYSEAELLSKTFMQITHPEDLAMDIAEQNSMMRGESDTYRLEKRCIRKDGSFIWVNLNVSIIKDKAEKPMYMVEQIENITERMESETKFQNLVENFIVGVYIVQNHKLVYVNPRITEETGYSEDEIIGMPIDKFIYTQDLQKVKEMIDARLNLGSKTVRYETRIKRKDGVILWYEILGSTILYGGERAVIGTMANITVKKAEHDDLLRSEANLKSIFDTTDVYFLLLDTDYNVIALNQNMMNMYRAVTDVILEEGMNLVPAIVPEKREMVLAVFDKVIKTNQAIDYESTYIRNGSPTVLLANVKPINDEKKVIGLCISTLDITERKKSLEQLKRMNDNLEKKASELAISNAELEQFAFVASHDLQEPLRMITSFLTLLERKYGDSLDEKAKQYIAFATDGAKRMRQIILDLLEYSRVGRVDSHLEEVNLDELVKDTLILFRKTLEETKATVRFKDLPTITVYKAGIRLVLQNLISNALKYHKPELAPLIEITVRQTNNEFAVTISDNGIGIDPEYFNHIFIIFKRLHPRDMYDGTGMGLAITKKVIEHIGGKIWVTSKDGEGSAFHFTIPKI